MFLPQNLSVTDGVYNTYHTLPATIYKQNRDTKKHCVDLPRPQNSSNASEQKLPMQIRRYPAKSKTASEAACSWEPNQSVSQHLNTLTASPEFLSTSSSFTFPLQRRCRGPSGSGVWSRQRHVAERLLVGTGSAHTSRGSHRENMSPSAGAGPQLSLIHI